MNMHIKIRLLGLLYLIPFEAKINAASSLSTVSVDNITSVHQPTTISPFSLYADQEVIRQSTDRRLTITPVIPRLLQQIKSIDTPTDELLKSIIAIEVRGLAFIAERTNCNSDFFELDDQPDGFTNDILMTSILGCLTDENIPSVLFKIKSIIQEFGHIQCSTEKSLSIPEELQAQYKRLTCMRSIIKLTSNEVAKSVPRRYERLCMTPKVSVNGHRSMLFEYKPHPNNTRQATLLQRKLRQHLFQNKTSALAALKHAKNRLADLL